MSADISVKIDLNTGLIEVVAPPEHFKEVFTDVKAMLEIAQTAKIAGDGSKGNSNAPAQTQRVAPVSVDSRKDQTQGQRGRLRQPGGSSGRPGRIGSFEPVNLGLSEDQERKLLQFYAKKSPTEQTHQVAVAMYQGEKELNRKSFSYDEVYTLLRLSGEKELPKALDVVVNRMSKDNWVIRDAEGISLKFVARDFVEKSLPTTSQ